MNTSYYTICFNHGDKKFIYNTLSTAIAQINDDIDYAIKNNDYSNLSKDVIQNLYEQHFIVKNLGSEFAEYLYFYDRTRFNTSARSFYLTLIPSYNCNLACPYCYEGQGKPMSVMTYETLEIISKFYEKHIIESEGNINQAVVRFYGGEPLLNKNIIFEFAKRTKAISDKLGIPVRYDMATNFTLVDNEILEFIKNYNISLQVTIDGTRESHNKRRIYKNGNGTYDVIISNLKRAAEIGIKDNITIRVNIDENNLSEAEESLIKIKEYSNYIYFGLLTEYKELNDEYSKQCIELKSYSKIVSTKLNPIAMKHGYSMLVPFGKQTPCAMVSDNKFFIDDKLNVYKCELLVNREDTCVGKIDINGNFVENKNFYNQMKISPVYYTKCRNCKLLPLCAGGCPAKMYIAAKKHDGIFDHYYCEFTRKSLIDYLKFYVDHPE